MEPYRPFVDRVVVRLYDENPMEELQKEQKEALLALLAGDVYFSTKKRPLMNALSLSSASLVRCFTGEEAAPVYPRVA